jgi:hypothetical protein
VGDRSRARQAAGHRDHQRLGSGRRGDVLVRGPDAGQGRLRGAHLQPAGPGPVRHLRSVADQNEGVPAQTDGRPFYDGTEDAINFLLSSPSHPYEPIPSCSTGTSHAAKQNPRVGAGLDTAYNPYYSLLGSGKIGLVGHSYGAAGVSYIAHWDPRVGAVVALDNLGGPGPDAGSVPGMGSSSTIGEQGCPADPADRTTVPITKPALGISADYGLPPTPNTSLPDPTLKEQESKVYSQAGVDSGELVIRGGSHLDFSFIPNQAFGASLRGPDLTDWYTTAWFDKYLKHDPSADARLLTDRWRSDPVEAGVDPNHDGNAFSFYYYSRLDIHLAQGGQWDCEDLRDGCPGMVANDGYPRQLLVLHHRHLPGRRQRSRGGPQVGLRRSCLPEQLGHHGPPGPGPRSRDHEGQGVPRWTPGPDRAWAVAALGDPGRPARQRGPSPAPVGLHAPRAGPADLAYGLWLPAPSSGQEAPAHAPPGGQTPGTVPPPRARPRWGLRRELASVDGEHGLAGHVAQVGRAAARVFELGEDVEAVQVGARSGDERTHGVRG